MFRNNSPFTNGSPRPGRLTWFMDSEGIEGGLSGTSPAPANVLNLKECFFSAELPVNNRHLFFGIPVRSFLWEGILWSAQFCLSCSPPHFELLWTSTLIPERYPKMSLERKLWQCIRTGICNMCSKAPLIRPYLGLNFILGLALKTSYENW